MLEKNTEELIKKQYRDLIRRTIELTELKGQLEDRSFEKEEAIKKLEGQNRELVRKTIELTELKGNLEDKALELESAYSEITDLLRAKTEFINRAAHDLRTPLTPIISLLPIIKMKVKDERISRDLLMVEKNAKYLMQLLNELIEFIKSGSLDNETSVEKVSINEVINEVLQNEEKIFDMKKIRIIKKLESKLPHVQVNRLRITEVIRNIVSNALKFTPKNGSLTILTYKKNKFIYVEMMDTGIGMSKKTLSHIFEPFFKADTSRHREGTGLGLLICKKIIEGYNGQIQIKSKGSGKGSAVTFTLPIVKW